MEIQTFTKGAFSVIGKEGSTDTGPDFVRKLWEEVNGNFDQIVHLALKREDGSLLGVWGAMTDFSGSFQPWENGFTRGRYLAGAECPADTIAPQGWTKWDILGYVYLKVKCTHDQVFSQMIAYLEEKGIPLAGAVQEFIDPGTGEMFLCFPIQRLG